MNLYRLEADVELDVEVDRAWDFDIVKCDWKKGEEHVDRREVVFLVIGRKEEDREKEREEGKRGV